MTAMTFGTTHASWLCSPLLVCALAWSTGCPGDDGSSTETTTVAATAGSSGQGSTADTTAGMETTAATGSTLDCADATDEAACGTAQNQGEGGGCTWMAIAELTIEGETCNFTPTDRGACVGTSGLDDGCNQGLLCDSNDVEAYYSELSPGVWEMAQGQACRGITGFSQCTDTVDAPCSCACEIP